MGGTGHIGPLAPIGEKEKPLLVAGACGAVGCRRLSITHLPEAGRGGVLGQWMV